MKLLFKFSLSFNEVGVSMKWSGINLIKQKNHGEDKLAIITS